MTANQERRLLVAALDYAEHDARCRAAQKDPTISRKEALRQRALAKKRLISAAGRGRAQLELDPRPALR